MMESATESLLADNAPTAPRLWQLWRPFVGIHRWYFSPGCPPPLRNLEGWTGWVHASVLFGAMGGVSSLAILVIMATLESIRFSNYLIAGGVVGFFHGLLVISPMARWDGRTKFGAIAGSVVGIVCYGLAAGWSQEVNSILTKWIGGGIQTRSVWFLWILLLNGVPSLIITLFLLGLRSRTSWTLLAVSLLTLVPAFLHVFEGELGKFWPVALRMSPLGSLLLGALPTLWYWTLLAVVLGCGLWPSIRHASPIKSP